LEISVGIDVIKDYKLKVVKPLDLIFSRYEQCEKYFNVIGFLLHQWAFDSKEKLSIIRRLLVALKNNSHVSFRLIEEIDSGKVAL